MELCNCCPRFPPCASKGRSHERALGYDKKRSAGAHKPTPRAGVIEQPSLEVPAPMPEPRWMPSSGSSQLPMNAPTIPMMRSPTIPNPVPCTIWPASHPAMRPTPNMIRRLSFDMCNFVSSRLRIAGQIPTRLRNASLLQYGLAAGEHSPIREEGDDPPMLVRLRPCYGKDFAEMLTTRGLRIVSTCPRFNKMSTFKC